MGLICGVVLMTPVNLVILALASWRLAYFIVYDDAPYKIMKRIRDKFPNWQVLDCIYCASVWTAIICYALLLTSAYWIVDILAVSGGAMMFWRYTGGKHMN